AAGRNKPARPVAEQTVEGVRNAEDGTSARGWDPGQEWTPPVDAAMRDQTLGEALSGLGRRKSFGHRGQAAGRRTLKEAQSSREDEAAGESWRWTADEERPLGPAEMPRSRRERGTR